MVTLFSRATSGDGHQKKLAYKAVSPWLTPQLELFLVVDEFFCRSGFEVVK